MQGKRELKIYIMGSIGHFFIAVGFMILAFTYIRVPVVGPLICIGAGLFAIGFLVMLLSGYLKARNGKQSS
ncbi:hypothetical protein KDH_66670 [Dictyobacter sp. S3.2.2.5]|uniref:YrhK domain-containing protein n=1 Tax=Dictyobacter halimunensis TaxID=3026934 RepID=A0ABQ6G4X8_9CHLR|nr:hypothetical protein KDH_66670 [Dictyobacter sp. S3.2.2.5]